AGDLGTGRGELVDHGVAGVRRLEVLPARLHGDLLCQVTFGHRGGDLGDRPDLVGEVARHEVHRRGQIPPGTGDPWHGGLTTQSSFDADLAGHPGDLGTERGELVDHRVDGVLELEDLALDVHGDLLCQVTLGHRRGDPADVAHLIG